MHLLFRADARDAIAALMQSLAGEFSSRYNRRKGRSNAFWGERYHATLVESLAVGSRPFVERIQGSIKNRSELEMEESGGAEPSWCLRETTGQYA